MAKKMILIFLFLLAMPAMATEIGDRVTLRSGGPFGTVIGFVVNRDLPGKHEIEVEFDDETRAVYHRDLLQPAVELNVRARTLEAEGMISQMDGEAVVLETLSGLVTVERGRIYRTTKNAHFEEGTFLAWARLYRTNGPSFLSAEWLAGHMGLSESGLIRQHVQIEPREDVERPASPRNDAQPLRFFPTEIYPYVLGIYENGALVLSQQLSPNGPIHALLAITGPQYIIRQVRIFGDLIIADFENASTQGFSLRAIIGPEDRRPPSPEPEPTPTPGGGNCEDLNLVKAGS